MKTKFRVLRTRCLFCRRVLLYAAGSPEPETCLEHALDAERDYTPEVIERKFQRAKLAILERRRREQWSISGER